MGLLVEVSDFEDGRYGIALNNFEEADLEKYIENYEEPFLIDLLGKALFDLFKASVTNHEPAAGVYKTIFDPIIYDDEPKVINSLGMKKMIQGVIYFYFERERYIKNTSSGPALSRSETSKNKGIDFSAFNNRWNDSFFTAEVIQKYIEDHLTDYPTYNGRNFCKKYGLQHWGT
jgi:hypothetical protein